MTNKNWLWVDDERTMAAAAAGLGRATCLGIDTEYDSFRYFREKLCLIQVNTGEKTCLVDPLKGPAPLMLKKSFADPAVLKIMHAGDNDIRILKRDYGFQFQNVFDTHRAAALLGSKHLALSTLIGEYLGITFDKEKKMQRSRWDIRPLSEDQLRYAVADTEHLFALYRKLNEGLRLKGLEAEAVKVFGEIAAAEWREKECDRRGHERINGYQGLQAEERRRLQKLFRWRFQKAKEINRALFMVLSEGELIALAKAEIASAEELRTGGILSAGKTESYGRELLEVLQREEALPPGRSRAGSLVS